ncbi:hypothetical protein Cgig2_023931 [Carnegiea gigantea]|uniref:Uncharacterized protein n=1 Tax=Carnegiea gigantea TaxID=171969 RepID=A0A9Q1K1S1_9CARY|nr:hypothetical protein Cgig2_023931 [Carnegiea gigantea]
MIESEFSDWFKHNGGHKHRCPSTSADIPTSTPSTCPFVVPSPPPFPEGFAYTSSYGLQPNILRSYRSSTTIKHTIYPQSVAPRSESNLSKVTSQALHTSEDRDIEEVDFDITVTNEQAHPEDTKDNIEEEEEEEKEEEVDEDNEDEDEIRFKDNRSPWRKIWY